MKIWERQSFKLVKCKVCKEPVKVDSKSVAATCWRCVSDQLSCRIPILSEEEKNLDPDCQDK